MDGEVTGVLDGTGAELEGGLLGDLGGGETETVETETEGVETETEGAETETEGSEEETEAGGAATAAAKLDKTRAEVVKFLRQGRTDEQLKPIYDALSKAWYRDQEYAALGDIKDLRGLKEQIDILGGPEAIGRLRDLETSVETIDKMVDTGDPQVIKDMFSESPEGMKKLVPEALETLKNLDARAYAATLTPHLVAAVAASGLGEWIGSAQQLIDQAYAAKDPEHARFYMEKAFQQVTGVANWLKGLEKQGTGNREQGTGNGAGGNAAAGRSASAGPEGGRAAAAAAASQELSAQVQRQLVPWAKTQIETALKPLLGATKLDAAKMNDMISLTAAEIDRRLTADTTFQGNLQAWQKTGKLDRIVKQSQSGISSVLAASARAVWERHGTKAASASAKAPARPAGGGAVKPAAGAGNKTVILVSRKPADGDFAANQDMIDVKMKQQGRLKDGRLVRWK